MSDEHTLRRVFIFLALCLGTVLAYCTFDKYIENGDQLLANHDFVGGLQGWQVDGPTSAVVASPGLLRLRSSNPQASVQVLQRLDPTVLGELVVLKGEIKTIGIEGGKEGWKKGRVILLQYVDGKAVYNTPHVLVALDGTHEWKEYRMTLPILPWASEVRVGLQLSRCVGELQAKSLSVLRVEANPSYRIVRWLVIGGWGLFAIVVFGPGVLDTCAGRRRGFMVLLVCIAIIFGTTMPGALKEEAKNEILSPTFC